MDSVGITTIVVIAGITMLIVVYQMMAKAKRKNKIKKEFEKVAQECQCKIDKLEYAGGLILGNDDALNYFFIMNTNDKKCQAIELSSMQKCRVNNVTRTVGSGKEMQSATDRIDLIFLPSDKKKAEIVIECYNAFTSMQLGNELDVLEKWVKQINEQIARLKGKK